MGVSQVIAYVLLFFITISLGLIALGAYIKSQQFLLHAEYMRQNMDLNQLNTRIFIKNVAINSYLLYMTITNNGSTVLYDFKDFAIIIKYYANVSNVSTLIISNYNYSTSLGTYKWVSNTVLINPNMVGTFIADLPYPPYPNTEATVVVVSNYGPEAIWRGVL